VIAPDDDTAFVANRADGTIVKVTGLSTAVPEVSAPLAVGSEPTGVALSPTGKRLYVAEFAEGRVSVIDTSSMEIVGAIEDPVNPRALAVTNDGDDDDDDEQLVVPEFFGEPVGVEGSDTSRTGRIRIYATRDNSPAGTIALAPLSSGFAPTDAAGNPIGPVVDASPNQLGSAIVIGNKVYATTISVSPAPPIKFNVNIQPIVAAVDLATMAEVRDATGTVNLAALVKAQVTGPKNFLADLVDIAFVGTDTAYVLSRGGDAVQRVTFDATGPQLGSPQNKQIDIGVGPDACQTPIGIVAAHDAASAYVNCWVSRKLAIVDLASQSLVRSVDSAAIPSAEVDVNLGRRFYFTARGRWSNEAWESCGSCHTDGLTDNVTWIFGSGPRQTVSMDGTFSKARGRAQQQKVLNYSGIFDELHDFERNTRGVSGGLGAITDAGPAGCGMPGEVPRLIALDGLRKGKSAANLNDVQPAATKEVQDQPNGCTDDFDKIEAWVKTIRPPRAKRFTDAESVARGAAIFAAPGTPGAAPQAAGCANCHGGVGWTVSRQFYRPSTARTDALAVAATGSFAAPPAFPSVAGAGAQAWNFHSLQIAPQPPSNLFDGVEANTAVGPNQVACVIRNVGTFGVPGDALATNALEVRNPDSSRAQGRLGYNPPSLYGLAVGAPYLHHGGAKTLDQLFDDARWRPHAEAGSAVWLRQGSAQDIAQRKADLIAFLLSIDADTAVQDIPSGLDACPANDP
jgi:DNA-binding beta-propeller fold protein YncE